MHTSSPHRRAGRKRALISGLVGLATLAGCSSSTSTETSANGEVNVSAPSSAETSAPTETEAPTAAPTTAMSTTAPPTEPPTTAPTTTVSPAASVVIAVEGSVSTSTNGKKFTPIKGGVLAVGATVRTADKAGAALTFSDGSIVRVGAKSTFVLDRTMQASRGTLTSGRAMHRVAPQTADAYAVATPYGTVTAKGTTFVTSCITPDACSIVVLEGVVDVAPKVGKSSSLKAAQAQRLTAKEAAAPQAVNWDSAFGDPWVVEAAGADSAVGFADAAELAAKIGPSFGSFKGVLEGTRTVTDLTCTPTGHAKCMETPGKGDVVPRSYKFDIDCSFGYPCVGVVDTEFGTTTGESQRKVVPGTFDGTTFTWERSVSDEGFCEIDFESDGTIDERAGTTTNQLTWRMTPTAGDVVDGVYRVTAAKGDVTANTKSDGAGCVPPGIDATVTEADYTYSWVQKSAIEVTLKR